MEQVRAGHNGQCQRAGYHCWCRAMLESGRLEESSTEGKGQGGQVVTRDCHYLCCRTSEAGESEGERKTVCAIKVHSQ